MTEDLLYRLIWLSRPLMQAAEAAVDRGLAGTGLTVRTRAVLEILHDFGDATVPEIAHRLEINRQYVQTMVNETLASELTVRRANPRHRASPLIGLTATGRETIAAVLAAERKLVGDLAQSFDDAEVATALDVVQRLTEALRPLGRERPA